jgi:hypothetical protein
MIRFHSGMSDSKAFLLVRLKGHVYDKFLPDVFDLVAGRRGRLRSG